MSVTSYLSKLMKAAAPKITRKSLYPRLIAELEKYKYEDPHIRYVLESLREGERPGREDAHTARRALMNLYSHGASSFDPMKNRPYSKEQREKILATVLDLERVIGSRALNRAGGRP